MFLLRKPTADDVHHFLDQHREDRLTYGPIGLTRPVDWWESSPAALSQFSQDHESVELGSGREIWEMAVQSLTNWRMFPSHFASLFWPSVELKVGNVVLAGIRLGAVWSINPCRIVYLLDEVVSDSGDEVYRFGFGYGTLPGHVECGEERFLVTWNRTTDSVRYEVSSYSRPNHWAAWVGYPFVRWLQARFRYHSCKAMRLAVMPQSLKSEARARREPYALVSGQ